MNLLYFQHPFEGMVVSLVLTSLLVLPSPELCAEGKKHL